MNRGLAWSLLTVAVAALLWAFWDPDGGGTPVGPGLRPGPQVDPLADPLATGPQPGPKDGPEGGQGAGPGARDEIAPAPADGESIAIGRVLAAEDGQPITDATVTAFGRRGGAAPSWDDAAPLRVVQTDADGRYDLQLAAIDDVEWYAVAPGRAAVWRRQPLARSSQDTQPQRIEDLRLPPGGAVAGHVLDGPAQDGQRIALWLEFPPFSSGAAFWRNGRHPGPPPQVVAAGAPAFRFDGVPHDVVFQVWARSEDGATARSGALRLDAEHPHLRGLELALLAPGRVLGRLIQTDGGAAADVVLPVLRLSTAHLGDVDESTTTDAQGRFTMTLPPGRYRIREPWHDRRGRFAWPGPDFDVAPGGRTDLGALAVQLPLPLTGRVDVASALAGERPARVRLDGFLIGPAGAAEAAWHDVRTDDDGRVQVGGVAPGDYLLVLDGSADDADDLFVRERVRAGTTGATWVARRGLGGVRVQVVDPDRAPLAAFEVHLRSADGGQARYAGVSASTDGTVPFDRLLPGPIQLVVSAADHRSAEVPFVVTANAAPTVVVPLERAPEPAPATLPAAAQARLQGVARDRGGLAAPFARVRLLPRHATGERAPRDAETDADGRYALDELAPGPWKLQVLDRADHVLAEMACELLAGDNVVDAPPVPSR